MAKRKTKRKGKNSRLAKAARACKGKKGAKFRSCVKKKAKK